MSRAALALGVAAILFAGCAPVQAAPNVHLPVVHQAEVEPPTGPGVESYPADMAIRWFKLFVQMVKRSPGFTPPIAARAFGYAGVTLYEALAPGMSGYQSLSGQLNAMPAMPAPPSGAELHWPTVANAALATIARLLFPTVSAAPLREIDRLDAANRNALRANVDPVVFDASEAWGRRVADAVYAWSLSDGGADGYLQNVTADFALPQVEGVWRPTPPDYAPPMLPRWGEVRPLLVPTADACAPPPPPEWSTDPESRFYQEAREVYDSVRTLNEERREIALFWADDVGTTATPPGHSLSIANQVLQMEGSSLAKAAELYAKLGIALNDAFIACWRTKFIYNVMRPITYIQEYIDPDWNRPNVSDPLNTPPFPEYTSGHSVESRAAAEILAATFGDPYRFTDITHVDRGLAPRTFSSFYAAAAEAAISRMYGGIHYRSAIEQGLAQGACIGKRVLEVQFREEE